MGLYEILKASKLGAGAAPDMYTALLAQKIGKGGSGGEAELSGVPPLTFRSNGTPLIDYLISGNTTQTGTPSPASPIMPQGTGERTGNLCPVSTWTNSQNTDTKTFFQLSITLYNGTTSLGERRLDVRGTGRFALTSVTAGENGATRLTVKHNGSTRDLAIVNVYDDFPPNQQLTISFDVSGYDPTVIGGISISNIMLNSGSTALPYEPYGIKIPILSNSTTTPVYLGEVQSTRRIKKLVLDGTEDWRAGTENFYIFITSQGVPYSSAICTHAKNSSINNNGTALWMKKVDFPDTPMIADFKSYLAQQYAAGTPVCVWYVLATEETAVVNEPLMRIGDYADTVNKTQAGVNIPTNIGSTTVDVDTTVKPSEVYIKYMGG